MKSWSVTLCLLSSLAFLAGCAGEGSPKITNRADVAGTVNLDGKPLAEMEATISFVLPGEAPAVLDIKEGKFSGQAPIGNPRVEIRAMKQGEPTLMDGKPVEGSGKYNFIAPQFNDQSTLTAKIPAGGNKDLKFDVEAQKQ